MKKANIALVGLGTVGAGVYKALQMQKARIEHKEGLSLCLKKVLCARVYHRHPRFYKGKGLLF